MPINNENIDLIIQYSLLSAGEEEDYLDRKLGPIHIIKYVYLADLIYAKQNNGQTFTGISWIFYKFGPWSQAVNARIAPALHAIHANQNIFPSDYEDKEDWVRWELQDDNLYNEKHSKIPSLVALKLKQLIHKLGNDTPTLLNYVYRTPPMLLAAPNESLDFTTVLDEQSKRVTDTANLIKDNCTKKQLKKFNQGMQAIRKKFQEQKNNKCLLINPIPNPRYDDIYEGGIEWLDSLSGNKFSELQLNVEFTDEVWKSKTRSGDGFS